MLLFECGDSLSREERQFGEEEKNGMGRADSVAANSFLSLGLIKMWAVLKKVKDWPKEEKEKGHIAAGCPQEAFKVSQIKTKFTFKMGNGTQRDRKLAVRLINSDSVPRSAPSPFHPTPLNSPTLLFFQWGDKNSGLEMVASAIDSGRGIWLPSVRG